MKINKLLVGTTAALAFAPAAMAADAVVIAEPEPVDYVRVCDAFGAGFFYIPGTETCLRISGYVRYRVGATSDDGLTDTPNFNGYAPDGWNKQTRARVNIDARQDTEWGVLRSYLRLQSSWGVTSDGAVSVDQAWISLGGLRMGYTESAWADTISGVDTTGTHSDGALWYGDQQRHLIQYNFSTAGGLFGVISLEDDTLSGVYGTGSSYGAISGGMGNAEWAALASYYHQFTSTVGGSVGFEYFNDFYAGNSSVSTGLNGYVAELSMVWEPIDNFEIRSEVTYDKIDTRDGSVGGFLSFKRSF
jgi:hypothetical protein